MYDNVSEARYRAIYDEVREATREDGGLRALREVLAPLGCEWSIAAWSKYRRGKLELSREARNALRAYAGLPELPPPPAEVVARSGVELVVVASDAPDTAVLVGAEVERVDLRRNGVKRGRGCPPGVRVTQVTAPRRARKPRTGITVCREVGEALKRLKTRRGQTWDELLQGLVEGVSDG